MIATPGDPAGGSDVDAPAHGASGETTTTATLGGAGAPPQKRWRPAMLAAGLLLAAAQVVFSWFLLSSLNQLRDQTAAANGLQRCLISAQLNQLTSTDNAAYRNAVRSCLDR